MGKPTEVKGDSLSGFAPDLSSQQLQEFLAGPLANAALLLGQATTRIVYDLDRYRAAQQPAFAATLARETHVSDPLPSSGLKVQLRFVYSNGFGREAQTKVQAEPGPLDLADPNSQVADPRWVGTGEKVCNNKGKPVRQAASAEGAAFRAGGRTPWLPSRRSSRTRTESLKMNRLLSSD
jgi:hypothetical protein